eukprot:1151860-Pelagomonas_calceolata.AAC.5
MISKAIQRQKRGTDTHACAHTAGGTAAAVNFLAPVPRCQPPAAECMYCQDSSAKKGERDNSLGWDDYARKWARVATTYSLSR